MHKISTFILILFSAFTMSYAQGIDFKHMPFEDALTQAKAEDKLIFIDFYTEWCGPCKKLAAGPFKEEGNGEFYNKHFISLKLDAEKEGKGAALRYHVTAYPTLIFVNGDGEIVHQTVGITVGDDMIGFGKEAMNASNAKYSWAKLQEMFPEKQDDEVFLKLYMEKMEEFGADPSPGIDAWLKVQTEFTETDPEMMEFLMKRQYEIYVGTKAEEIYNTNLDHYLSLSNEYQRKNLTRLRRSMLLRSVKKARRNEDAEMMRVIIDRLQQYDIKPRSEDDINTFKMDLYRFSNDYDSFKRLAEKYVDSLIQLKSIRAIKKEDADYYALYSKNKEFGQNPTTDVMLQKYKEGRIASDIVELIVTTAQHYFDHAETKKEFKILEDWVDYCYKLIPESYFTDNLKADILFKEGKVEKAIQLKTTAIENMPFTVKKKVNYKYELELMKQNQS
ncbi:thioredoxin family protein [Robertkochia solimangrovi]|uniref:thioredoxin family protein n=1 Tax=Robertkochia solimangrovi TaxID=2213046 RepID=UPI0011805868|nr:thioredoxin family protein [Robertkochia solimangrovi]TRZ42413.1 hypothetical protein DMZ48_12930 [Robertkochia solimangrovi]